VRNGWEPALVRAVCERLRMLLEAISDPLPEWVWPWTASILAAMARYYGLVEHPIPLAAGFRSLSYSLCDPF
jgi:hypothetical protein